MLCGSDAVVQLLLGLLLIKERKGREKKDKQESGKRSVLNRSHKLLFFLHSFGSLEIGLNS